MSDSTPRDRCDGKCAFGGGDADHPCTLYCCRDYGHQDTCRCGTHQDEPNEFLALRALLEATIPWLESGHAHVFADQVREALRR